MFKDLKISVRLILGFGLMAAIVVLLGAVAYAQVGSISNRGDEIVLHVRRVADLVREITSASEDQSSGIAQINQAMAQMDQVTQQNAALVEEAAAAAGSLDGQAKQMVEVVDDIRKRLITYTLEHLEREERFLASVHFPNLAQHPRGHQAFAKGLNGLKARYEDCSITVASQLSSVLRDWL